MTKVDILRLDSVTNNDTTATSTINTNFQAIQEAMENTLSRDGSIPNFMDADLDMNSYKIINAGDPENDTDVITKGWFDQYVDDAAGASAAATAAADRAEGSAQAAQTAAAQAAIAAAQIGDNVRLSRDWAIKTDGTVDGVDYSSKYYAQQIIPIASDITTVSGIASDVTTVSGISSDVTTVADNNTDISAVASDIVNVNSVAGDLTNIDTVAGITTDISAVSGIASDVSDVADNETNINTVAGVSSDITTVAGLSSDVTTVASNTAAVSNVSTYMSSVRLCADDISNINTVAVDINNVIDVADNKTNIDTVAANISDVSAVATNVSDVSTVAGISSDVGSVASNATDISTVATDIANINAVAGDLTNIDNASTYAAEAKQWAIGDPTEPVGNSAKYWAQQAAGQAIPSQTGHSGEFLTTDGSSMSWNAVDALPSQTGQAGKYLTTDGTNPSWNTITIPSVDVDGISINRNTDDELQTIGVINQNDTTTAIKTWTGTKAQYDAIVTKDPNTLYNITDGGFDVSLLDVLYPVGSIYITTNATCPLQSLGVGTWILESSGIVTAGDIPCKGNGMTLGLTNGTRNGGLNGYYNDFWYNLDPTLYGKNVGTSGSSQWGQTNKSVGVTTDSTKSGIVADTSSLILAVNIFRRIS